MKCLVLIFIISTAWAVSEQYGAKSLGIEPSRLVIIGGKEYEIGAVSVQTTYQAMMMCDGLGKTLVNLDDPEKNQLIREFLVAEGRGAERFWTSGTKISSGIWLWQGRGQLFKDTDWATGEPSSFKDCVYVTGDLGWGAEICIYGGQEASYICEDVCLD